MRWSGSGTSTALSISSSRIMLTVRDAAACRCGRWRATSAPRNRDHRLSAQLVPDSGIEFERLELLRQGKSHAAFPADEEEIAPLEEFERDVGERLRLLGADGIINDREVVVGQQRAIAIAGTYWSLVPESTLGQQCMSARGNRSPSAIATIVSPEPALRISRRSRRRSLPGRNASVRSSNPLRGVALLSRRRATRHGIIRR